MQKNYGGGDYEHARGDEGEAVMGSSILDQPAEDAMPPDVSAQDVRREVCREEWRHPDSEAERLIELESFLANSFDTFREVRIEHQWMPHSGRIDLLAVPKIGGAKIASWSKPFDIEELDGLVLAFEVKRDGFDVERALKQSADYVGGTVLEGPHKGKSIAACFLYPTGFGDWRDRDHYHSGMFNLIAQWRVGCGYMSRAGVVEPELTLAIGFVVIWRSQRGWTSKACDMLSGKRSMGGSRREIMTHLEERILGERLSKQR
jgi:hypothetical protein